MLLSAIKEIIGAKKIVCYSAATKTVENGEDLKERSQRDLVSLSKRSERSGGCALKNW